MYNLSQNKPKHKETGWSGLFLSILLLALAIVAENFFGKNLVIDFAFVVVLIYAGYGIALSGFKALLKRNISIDLLVSVAAIGATLIGHLEEGASVVLLFNVAERLEDYAGDRARRAIEELIELKPEVALIKRNGVEVEVPVEVVMPGEIFVVRPGGRIPLDGEVVSGASSVNQSTITGEAAPIAKRPGSEIFAGTINVEGFIEARVTRPSGETILSKIQRLVEEAEESKSPTEAFVDRFSRYYTPLIIASAFFVAVIPPIVLGHNFMDWIYRSLIMLVIACPCALAISTPVAMVSAIASASRNGVLIKGSNYIELLSSAKVVAFDKTGTLTKGNLEVSEVRSLGEDEDEVLRCAASLEAQSEHPIAEAIAEKAKSKGVITQQPGEFRSYPGMGITATLGESAICVGNPKLLEELDIGLGTVSSQIDMGKTVVLVSKDKTVIGSVTLSDRIREEAADTVKALKQRGLHVEMLTGDNESTAQDVATKIGADGYKSSLLPQEKVAAVTELKKQGKTVMVGDGVNDAPALAAADVGVAMGVMGSDVALETADIALMEDKLDRIPYIIDLSRATMSRIKENIALSLTVKLGVGVLAILGFFSLWMAVAIGDMGLTIAVVLNALRLSRIKPQTKPA